MATKADGRAAMFEICTLILAGDSEGATARIDEIVGSDPDLARELTYSLVTMSAAAITVLANVKGVTVEEELQRLALGDQGGEPGQL